MKPIEQMDSNAINCAIAELRGEMIETERTVVGTIGRDGQVRTGGRYIKLVCPDYLEWQRCGPLLEEMLQSKEYQYDIRYFPLRPRPWEIRRKPWEKRDFVNHIYAEELLDAVRRAWWEWKAAEDAGS